MQHIILGSLSLSLPNFSLPYSSIKAVFPLAAVSMAAHTDTMRHSPGSAVNHNQLVNNWRRFIIISPGPKLYMCELTHSADRGLQAQPLLFKTRGQAVCYWGEEAAASSKQQAATPPCVYIYAVINGINIPLVVIRMRWSILFFNRFIWTPYNKEA